MFSLIAKTWFDRQALQKAADEASFKSLGHAAAAIRLTAKRSIRRSKKHAPAGGPPNTQTGRLPKALRYAMDGKDLVVIGTDAAIVSDAGKPHELGGWFRGTRYDRRPFMAPALLKLENRLPTFWANSIR